MAESKRDSKTPAVKQPLDFNALIPKKSSLDELARKVIKERDSKELEKLIDEFRTVTLKKEVVRLVKLTELSDMADEEIGNRLRDHPERLRNSELLEFSGLIQNSMDRSNKHIDDIKANNNIQISNSTVNVTKNELNVNMSTASREKITNVVMSILKAQEADSTVVVDAEEVGVSSDTKDAESDSVINEEEDD